MQNWRAKEIRWLHDAKEDLERRLRRRTIALAAAVAFGGIAAVAGLAGALLNGDEPPAGRPPAAAEAPADTAPEALRAEREAIITRLRAELEDNRAEAESQREQLEASRREIERLNAALARATDPAESGAAPAAPPVGVTGTGSPSAPGTAGRAAAPGPLPVHRAPAVARPDGGAGEPEERAEAARSWDVPLPEEGGPGEQEAPAGPAIDTGLTALRAALAQTRARIEQLERSDAPHEVGAAEPGTGREGSRTEARTPGERLDAGRSGVGD